MSTSVVANPEAGAVMRGQGSLAVTVFFVRSSRRMLWIEADEKFVDILLNFLLLAAGAAVQAISRQVEGRPDPIGGLGNIFCNIESPGMQEKVPIAEVVVKLLNPPPVLSNSTRLENAYACAFMSNMRKECRRCGKGACCWEALWDGRYIFKNCQGLNPDCLTESKGLPGKFYGMAKRHTYIVTEKLEVRPSSVAKGMDSLG